MILGIDPGLDGALAFLDEKSLRVCVTPTQSAGKSGKRNYDLPAMADLLDAAPISLAIVEQVSAAPVKGVTQGTVSMFRFGQGYGLWLGMLAALRIPYELASPQTWKARILKGTAKDKAAAIQFCQQRFPTTSLLASPRCRTPHDGIADAICLAEYGRRILARAD